MADVVAQGFPVGLRHVRFYALNANSYPNATSTTVYEGTQIVGGQSFAVTNPNYQEISHRGDDRILAVDFLPPTEKATAELRVAREDLANLASFTGVTARDLGEARVLPFATNKQGSEPDVGLLAFQQQVDSAGARTWRSFQMPIVRIAPQPKGMDENPSEHLYQISAQVVNKYLWGEALSNANDGALEMQYAIQHTVSKPHVVAWLGDNIAVDFLFHADRQAVSTAKIHGVWVDGVKKVGGGTDYTEGTDDITFGVAPTSGALITCFYEYA
jgi:hypothetical protein